jgi:hypothetical protein
MARHRAGGDATIPGSQAVSIKSAACALAICLASSATLAQPAPMAGPMAALAPVLPPQEIGRILRTHGLVPQATPVRNGEAYQVRAVDRTGRQVRVAVDARYGDILMVRPIAMGPPDGYGPYGPPAAGYYGGPPPGTLGAYPPAPGVRPTPPPPEHAAALAPAHPPIPRPKPVAKPAAVTPAPAAAPEFAPEAAAPAGGDAPGTPPAPPAAAPSAPAAPAAVPPVAPLD